MSEIINKKIEEKQKELKKLANTSFEKIKWYHDHKDEIEKMNEYNKYLEEIKATAQMIKEKTWTGKMLYDNGYEIFDLNQANEDFKKLMGLDEITEIAGVYEHKVDGKNVQEIVSIKKNNFYNAFYEPIWQNLTDGEKIKSLIWMFEDINEKYRFDIKELSFFTKFENIDEYDSTLGQYDQEENSLYLNLNDLNESSSPLLLIEVLAHELTHARQNQLTQNFDSSKKHTFTELSHTDLGNFDYMDLGVEMHIDEATSYALYRVSQSEKLAEINGLKYVKKYIDLNEKDFGKNEDITKKYETLKHKILFNGTTKYKDGLNREHFTGTSGILTNEKVILKGQSETLLKLIMLKNFYEYKILEYYNQKADLEKEVFGLRKDFQKDRLTQEEWLDKTEKLETKIQQAAEDMRDARESVTYIKSVFMETIEKGKLPDKFNTREFDVLNILDEPKSEYSLPEWLREDEIAFNKKLDEEQREERRQPHTKIKNKNKIENIEQNKENTWQSQF